MRLLDRLLSMLGSLFDVPRGQSGLICALLDGSRYFHRLPYVFARGSGVVALACPRGHWGDIISIRINPTFIILHRLAATAALLDPLNRRGYCFGARCVDFWLIWGSVRRFRLICLVHVDENRVPFPLRSQAEQPATITACSRLLQDVTAWSTLWQPVTGCSVL